MFSHGACGNIKKSVFRFLPSFCSVMFFDDKDDKGADDGVTEEADKYLLRGVLLLTFASVGISEGAILFPVTL